MQKRCNMLVPECLSMSLNPLLSHQREDFSIFVASTLGCVLRRPLMMVSTLPPHSVNWRVSNDGSSVLAVKVFVPREKHERERCSKV